MTDHSKRSRVLNAIRDFDCNSHLVFQSARRRGDVVIGTGSVLAAIAGSNFAIASSVLGSETSIQLLQYFPETDVSDDVSHPDWFSAESIKVGEYFIATKLFPSLERAGIIANDQKPVANVTIEILLCSIAITQLNLDAGILDRFKLRLPKSMQQATKVVKHLRLTPRQAFILAALVGWKGDEPTPMNLAVDRMTLIAWAGSHCKATEAQFEQALDNLVDDGLFFEAPFGSRWDESRIDWDGDPDTGSAYYMTTYDPKYLTEIPEGLKHNQWWSEMHMAIARKRGVSQGTCRSKC